MFLFETHFVVLCALVHACRMNAWFLSPDFYAHCLHQWFVFVLCVCNRPLARFLFSVQVTFKYCKFRVNRQKSNCLVYLKSL